MPMRKTALLCLFLIPCLTFSITYLRAQVTFIMPADTILAGQPTHSEPITEKNIKDIVGTQFTLTWDNSVLNISSIDQLGFEDLSLSNHFNIESDSGWINFLYIDLGLTGVSLADDALLFRANFEVVGSPGDETEIRFSDDPTEREVTDTSSISTSQPVEASYENGFLMIEGTTSTNSSSHPELLRISEAYPNPFQGNINLSFYAKRSDTYQIEIFNLTGQILYRNPIYLSSGTQDILLGTHLFPEAGTYIIRLSGQNILATQKVLCTK